MITMVRGCCFVVEKECVCVCVYECVFFVYLFSLDL